MLSLKKPERRLGGREPWPVEPCSELPLKNFSRDTGHLMIGLLSISLALSFFSPFIEL